MNFFSSITEIERRLHAALEDERTKRKSTGRISLSEIGKCVRDLWAAHHGIPDERPPDGRALMTFDVGSALEDTVTGWLMKAGYRISTGADGQQWRVTIEGETGAEIASGRLDGLILWGNPREQDWRLIEVKTAKAKRYEELVEAGSYRAWNPGYYDQVQAYMGASHSSIVTPSVSDSLVLVVCKDDARVWSEMIRLDMDHFRTLEAKARVAVGDTMPEKPKEARGKSSKFCQWCSRKEWCYGPLVGVSFDD